MALEPDFKSDCTEKQEVHVEYFVNEQSIKERLHLYFIKNQRSTLRIRLINCFFKLLTVALYLVRAVTDDNPQGVECFNFDPVLNCSKQCIYWPAILCVNRQGWIYGMQCALAIINLLQVLLLLFLNYKGNILQQIMTVSMVLEAITTIPFIITIVYTPSHHLFVPVFLNCWLAKELLENLFNDLHRVMQRHHSALTQQVFILIVTILCLIITCACGIHHLERAGLEITVFEALYFTVVTFSTVGYGDIKVEIWPSQLFVIVMIASALVVLPVQMEKMALLLIEKQKQGGTYSNHRARTEKHVVVCASMLHFDLVNDFLNEFYAHAHLQDFFVVLLTPCELEATVKWLLQVPLWSQRVIYIQGSALKDVDLVRCRMDQAEACFILSPRNKMDRIEAALLKNWKRKKRLAEKLESIINRSYRDRADQQTILRTWAVKDFAPNIPIYVQIMKPENKFHVQFADHVVCEDEFKYALLANNCLCPATSTFVTLLIHTSRGSEGETASSQWQKIYGRCSGNEIYHIQLKQSQFFGEYEGKSFTYATFNAHKKYGVSLIGIKRQDCNADLQLNPGPKHILKDTDTCYYMNITKEEYSAFILAHPREEKEKLEKKDSKSSSPIVSDPNVSKLESAICSVGTLALEMHHYGPNNSTGESPEKQRTEPTGQENPGNATYHFDNDVESHFSYDFDHDDDDDSNSGDGGTLPIEMREQNNHPTYERSTLQVPSGDRHLLMPPPAGEEHVPSDAPPPGARRQRRPSIMPVSEMIMADNSPLQDHKPLYAHKEVQDESEDTCEEGEKWTKGYPPVMPYIGYSPMMCHLLETPKPHCCLELDKPCEHKSWTHAGEYNWPNNNIIIAAEYAAQGMVNFIVPLRAHFRPKHTLKPIIIMVEKSVDNNFLECISSFPMVYYMIGLLESLDDLLRAGMLQSDTVVVVDRESSKLAEEDYMADANQIVAVQTMFRLFPSTTIITELTHAANMRFMQFRAKDFYALHMAEKQKLEKEKGSNISYMFRLPFAAGNVFSASMLDTMLYQSFVKDYAISIVRLLLGLDQATNSGYLCELPITPEDMWIRTYGRLYQKLCSTSHEIPIGIYRTVGQTDNKSECSLPMEDDDSLQGFSGERKELANMVRIKMKKLDLPEEEYDSEVSDKRNKISYVIINPSFDMKLEVDDIIYLIKPAGGPKTPSPMPPRRKFSSRRKTTHQRYRAEPQGSNVDTKL